MSIFSLPLTSTTQLTILKINSTQYSILYLAFINYYYDLNFAANKCPLVVILFHFLISPRKALNYEKNILKVTIFLHILNKYPLMTLALTLMHCYLLDCFFLS